MKKILFCINSLGFGGAERVFVDDANALHDQGFEVHMVLLYGNEIKNPLLQELTLPHERIHFVGAEHILDYSAYKKIYTLISHFHIDVLYATLHDSTFVSRFVALCAPRVALITREANTTENKSFLHKIADVCMNWRVNTMIAVSKEVKKSMLSYQPWYTHKVKILHNGVDIPTDISTGDPARILAVGSLTAKKNYQMLIDAFELVHKSHPAAFLYIIGEGTQKQKLQELVVKKALQKHVVFLGKKNHQEVENEYRMAGVFALSSDQEGCPNVLLEAMSFGIPSVATAVGAVPEIIDDNQSGFVVPPRDSVSFAQCIIKYIELKDLRERMGLSGREKIKKDFSREVHGNQLKDILGI